MFVRAVEHGCVNSVGATKNERDEWHWPMFLQNEKKYIINTQLQMKVLGKIYNMLCFMRINL